MFKRDERGFTLPELLVVTGIVLVLLLIAISTLRITSHDDEIRDAERQLEIVAIAQAFQRYKADHNAFPADIPAKSTPIGSSEKMYNPCSVLVPKYIKDLPLDPEDGFAFDKNTPLQGARAGCHQKGVEYIAGYSISRENNAVTISALSSASKKLSITIR